MTTNQEAWESFKLYTGCLIFRRCIAFKTAAALKFLGPSVAMLPAQEVTMRSLLFLSLTVSQFSFASVTNEDIQSVHVNQQREWTADDLANAEPLPLPIRKRPKAQEGVQHSNSHEDWNVACRRWALEEDSTQNCQSVFRDVVVTLKSGKERYFAEKFIDRRCSKALTDACLYQRIEIYSVVREIFAGNVSGCRAILDGQLLYCKIGDEDRQVSQLSYNEVAAVLRASDLARLFPDPGPKACNNQQGCLRPADISATQ